MVKQLPLEEIAKLYTEDGLSCEAIATRYHVSAGTIWNRLNAAGVERRNRGVCDKYNHLTDQIVFLYSEQRHSIQQVSNEIGISKTAVRDRLLERGLLRDISGARTGIKFSESHRRHISRATQKTWADPEKRQRMIDASTDGKRRPEVRAHNSAARKGKPLALETRQKLSQALKGPKSYLWKGGISYEPYCPAFNDFIKESVREDFSRRCYLCGANEQDEKHHVHHVDYNKSQGCKGLKWSLIPLCRSCHTKTNHYRWHWFALLRDYWIYEHLDFNSNLF